MTTPFLTVTKGDLNIAIDLSSLLGSSVAPEPKAPLTSAPVRRTVQKATTSTTKAVKPPKRAKATKVARTSDKPLYAEIRRLTSAGQHDEAIALAAAEGWDHVVKSINSHRAKHAEPKAPKLHSAYGIAKPAPIIEEQPVVPKAPVKAKAQPKAAKAKGVAGTKLTLAKPKAAIAPEAPKVPATKAAAKRAVKAAAAPKGNKPQAFPTSGVTSEADLVLHWAAAKAAGHIDVLNVAHQATATAFGIAASKGDAHGASLQMKRLKNLDNLLAA